MHFIDTATGKEEHVAARVVILAASACESARLLMNSRSAKFPQGLGNTTGHLGRWLTDSTGSDLGGQIPALEKYAGPQRRRDVFDAYLCALDEAS